MMMMEFAIHLTVKLRDFNENLMFIRQIEIHLSWVSAKSGRIWGDL